MKINVRYDCSDERELIRVLIDVDPMEVRINETMSGASVEIDGFQPSGELGGPALPVAFVRVALPTSARMETIEVKEIETARLTEKPVLVASLQLPLPGAVAPPCDRPGDKEPHVDTRDRFSREQIVAKPFPGTRFVPLRADLYERALRGPKHAAELGGKQMIGLTPVVTVRVRPVRFDAKGGLELVTRMEVTVPYRAVAEAPFQEALEEASRLGRRFQPKVASRAQAKRAISSAKAMVVNPELVTSYNRPLGKGHFEYIVITDNHTWNAATMTPNPGAVQGDMVAAFQRLVDWKKARGLTARVMTISSILAARNGFRTGARDLQEAIRNFLKFAHAEWGTAWVLLGGDVGVVPVRNVIGAGWGPLAHGTDAKPADGAGSWSSNYYRIHWTGAWGLTSLVRYDTGKLIPQDPTGTATLGWYHVTDDTYATRSPSATGFIRVNGPAADVNGQYMVVADENTIPTDLYYASLVGSQYGLPGKHDWDLLDNGLHGQSNGGTLDGVSFTADVSVGRAPVSSAAEATAFVDKVIAYEKFQAPDGTSLSRSWPSKVVYAATSWGGRLGIGRAAGAAPGDNQYVTEAGGNARIQLATAPTSLSYNLISQVTAADVRTLPYATNGRGWYFARSATSLDPSHSTVLIWTIPLPSRWIVVRGDAADIAPEAFILDDKGLDGSVADTETLRKQIQTDYGFDDFTRLYEDEVDLTASDAAAGPIAHLTTDGIRAALNDGPHFVCLSGHGNWWGCCGLDNTMARGLTNGHHTFIAYADSCLTNRIDHEDAMSEDLLKNPNGGAVAYVGNTRFSWIGVGDNFDRGFWKTLKSVGHIGLAADVRCAMLNENTGYSGIYNQWAIFASNLLGDPEMSVWTAPPVILRERPLPRRVPRKPFPWPFPIEIKGDPEEYRVTVRQGERLIDAPVSAKGQAWIHLSDWDEREAEVVMTAPGIAPIVTKVTIGE